MISAKTSFVVILQTFKQFDVAFISKAYSYIIIKKIKQQQKIKLWQMTVLFKVTMGVENLSYKLFVIGHRKYLVNKHFAGKKESKTYGSLKLKLYLFLL